jgi:hypothetical protein
MQTNEWHAWRPPGRSPGGHNPGAEPYHKSPMPETTMHELFIEQGRKCFAVALKENQNGRFLRITEEKDNRRNTIIVPAEALEDFLTVVIEMVQTHKNQPTGEPPNPLRD